MGDEPWRDGGEEKQGKLKYSFDSTTVDILHETPPVYWVHQFTSFLITGQ